MDGGGGGSRVVWVALHSVLHRYITDMTSVRYHCMLERRLEKCLADLKVVAPLSMPLQQMWGG